MFRADATPPKGQPLIWTTPVTRVEDPLFAKGIVLEDGANRYVICALDWCGVSGATARLFRQRMAAAAGTTYERTVLHTVHQHAAPYIDGDAYTILEKLPAKPLMMSSGYLDELTERLAEEIRSAIGRLTAFDRIGTGEAKVERVASARRLPAPGGKVITRYSSDAVKPEMAAAPEGPIDPVLKTVTLAAGDTPLVRLHYYATHPQTFCCDGVVSADFVGAAREVVEGEQQVPQIYFTGCSGDVTVGKYNDRTRAAREGLADRLEAAMKQSIASTRFSPAGSIRWRATGVKLPLRTEPEFAPEALEQKLRTLPETDSTGRYRTAIQLSLTRRKAPLDVAAYEIGPVTVLHLPGEPMLEFQLFAQKQQPDRFVAVAGYSDLAPGYIITDRAYQEGGYEATAANAGPGSEAVLKNAIRKLLGK